MLSASVRTIPVGTASDTSRSRKRAESPSDHTNAAVRMPEATKFSALGDGHPPARHSPREESPKLNSHFRESNMPCGNREGAEDSSQGSAWRGRCPESSRTLLAIERCHTERRRMWLDLAFKRFPRSALNVSSTDFVVSFAEAVNSNCLRMSLGVSTKDISKWATKISRHHVFLLQMRGPKKVLANRPPVAASRSNLSSADLRDVPARHKMGMDASARAWHNERVSPEGGRPILGRVRCKPVVR